MKYRIHSIFLTLFVCAVLSAVFASESRAQGTTFTYQGRLNDSANPANGIYDFRASLFTTNNAGTLFAGPYTNLAVPVSNGLFTIPLDYSNVFNGTIYWLQIAVRTNGSSTFFILAPRQQLTPVPYSEFASSVSGLTIQPNGTSPNVLLGYSGNYMTNGAVSGTISGGGALGAPNSVTGTYGTVSGGGLNIADVQATVGGGTQNRATALQSTVAGGNFNLADGTDATVGGGAFNHADGVYATVAGGQNNIALGHGSFIGGGGFDGTYSLGNTASGNASLIGGGAGNQATATYAVVGGGYQNIASGSGAFIGGGGYDGTTFSGNNANGNASVTVGGLGNQANSYAAAVGGQGNVAGGAGSFVGGGQGNQINPSGVAGVIGGGSNNVILGAYGTIPGGANNTASGRYSFAAGQFAAANNQGAFVWADSQNASFDSTNNDSFNVRAQGGAKFVTGGAGLTVDGTKVLLAGGSATITNLVLSGTNQIAPLTVLPRYPFLILGSVSIASSSTYSIVVAGRYAYIANGSGSLQVIDVSSPSSPALVSSLSLGGQPYSVAVAGRYAYVANYTGNTLQVIDVGNPTSPTLVGSVSTGVGSGPQSVAVSGRYAYVVDNTVSSLQVFDVINPASPVLVGSVATGAQPSCVAVAGRYAYVDNYDAETFQVFDVSNPSSPVSVGSVGTGTSPFSVAVAGRYAYEVNVGSGTLQVIDVSNPSSPVIAGSLNFGGTPESVVVAGRYVYVSNPNNGNIYAVDVSNPSSPVILGSMSHGVIPYAIAVEGRYVYDVTAGSLEVLDFGGAYIQQFEAGTAEVGSLQTRDTVTVGNSLNVRGGLTASASARISGGLGADNIRIGGIGTTISNLQAGQTIVLGSSTQETNYTIVFPTAFSSTPKVVFSLANDPAYPLVNDVFAASICSNSPAAFIINVYRLNGTLWAQQLRINWQAWQ